MTAAALAPPDVVPPGLEYVAMVVDDPAASVELFAGPLGLPRVDVVANGEDKPAVGVGASALVFFRADDAFVGGQAKKGLHHIAIASESPAGYVRSAGLAQGVEVEPGLNGAAQVRVAQSLTCGVRTRVTTPLSLDISRSDRVERIDHLGVASDDNQMAKAVFIDRLGCVYESEQTDSEIETLTENFTSDRHGTVFRHRPSRVVGSMRVSFISVGDCELEFLQDLTVDVRADEARHDAAGNTRGDRSAIARYIASRGPGLHHIALKTPDIGRALAALHEAGYRVIDRQGRPGSRRARIGFVHPSALGGVLMHFVERAEV